MFRNWIIRIVWALGVLSAQSATYYVDCNRPDNTGDGLSWATAKRTIQAAVNAAASGDTIRVGPGTYGEGTTVTPSGHRTRPQGLQFLPVRHALREQRRRRQSILRSALHESGGR